MQCCKNKNYALTKRNEAQKCFQQTNEYHVFISSYRKFYSLCQGKCIRIIDRICLPTHINFPGITAAFSSSSGFLFPTKSASNLRSGSSDIYIRYSTITTGI